MLFEDAGEVVSVVRLSSAETDRLHPVESLSAEVFLGRRHYLRG